MEIIKMQDNLRIIEVERFYKSDDRDNLIIKIIEFSRFDKYKTMSNKGGIKFNFKKPSYIASSKFDTYEIVEVINYPVMVFSNSDFDRDRVIDCFCKYWESTISLKLENYKIQTDHLNKLLGYIKDKKFVTALSQIAN
jgi:hypothetical protein